MTDVTAIRLCGGRSLMLMPKTPVSIDLERVTAVFDERCVKITDDYVTVDWLDVPTTLYKSGGMMFYHLDDKASAVERYGEILARLGESINPADAMLQTCQSK